MWKELLEKLYKKCKGNLIYYDAMTEAYNRNYYEMVCKNKYANEEVHIYLIDVNKLKQINDENGHDSGDGAIQYLAFVLEEYIDCKKEVIRLGGDEFIVFAEKEVDMELVLQDYIDFCPWGFSYGYHHKTKNEHFSESIKEADIEMYNYKNRG